MDRFREIASLNIRPAITQDGREHYKALKLVFGFVCLIAGMVIGMALGMVIGG